METDRDLIELIDRASAIATSDYKLAQYLLVPRQNVSAWRLGKQPCPPEAVALMAALCGLNARDWLARAVIKRHEGTPKGDQLMRAMGKALAATGAALASSGANAAAIYSTTANNVTEAVTLLLSTMYRKVKFSLQLT